jgi:Cu/Ag efflux protein CusF
MRKVITPSIAALMVMSSSFVWAWEDVSGTVRSINHEARTVTLDDGKTYTLRAEIAHTDLKVGDKVTVSTQVEQGKNVVNKITKSG